MFTCRTDIFLIRFIHTICSTGESSIILLAAMSVGQIGQDTPADLLPSAICSPIPMFQLDESELSLEEINWFSRTELVMCHMPYFLV